MMIMEKPMFRIDTQCMNCDFEGTIEIQGATYDTPASRIFKRRGHNPFSDHMRYQCPACESILLADPMDILHGGFITDVRSKPRNRGLLQKIFLAPWNNEPT
jgi:hypothetical protein